MEQINPYAVMRNTATHEAYRSYMRQAHLAGQPFIFLGMLPSLVLPAAAALMRSHSIHRPASDWRWALTIVIASLALSLLSLGVGLFRVAKFRREHPIPDEWRPIPRVKPWPVAGRKPSLP